MMKDDSVESWQSFHISDEGEETERDKREKHKEKLN